MAQACRVNTLKRAHNSDASITSRSTAGLNALRVSRVNAAVRFVQPDHQSASSAIIRTDSRISVVMRLLQNKQAPWSIRRNAEGPDYRHS
jgi:hypothetical protein